MRCVYFVCVSSMLCCNGFAGVGHAMFKKGRSLTNSIYHVRLGNLENMCAQALLVLLGAFMLH